MVQLGEVARYEYGALPWSLGSRPAVTGTVDCRSSHVTGGIDFLNKGERCFRGRRRSPIGRRPSLGPRQELSDETIL